MKPTAPSVFVTRFVAGAGGSETRMLNLCPADPGNRELLEQLSALRLSRSPLSGLRRLLPETAHGRETGEGAYDYLLLASDGEVHLGVQFFVGRWSYTGPGQKRHLSCRVSGGSGAGRLMATDCGKWLHHSKTNGII